MFLATLLPLITEFLDDFAKKYGINEPHQWGTVTLKQIKKEKGGSLLHTYSGSLVRTLIDVYPSSLLTFSKPE